MHVACFAKCWHIENNTLCKDCMACKYLHASASIGNFLLPAPNPSFTGRKSHLDYAVRLPKIYCDFPFSLVLNELLPTNRRICLTKSVFKQRLGLMPALFPKWWHLHQHQLIKPHESKKSRRSVLSTPWKESEQGSEGYGQCEWPGQSHQRQI